MPKKTKTRRKQHSPEYENFLHQRMTLPPTTHAGQWKNPGQLANLSNMDDLMTKFSVSAATLADLRAAMVDAFDPCKHECEWVADAGLLVLVRRGQVSLPDPGSAVWKCLHPADAALVGVHEHMVQEGSARGLTPTDFVEGDASTRKMLEHFGDESGVDFRGTSIETVRAFKMRLWMHAIMAGGVPRVDLANVRTREDLDAIPFELDDDIMDASARKAVRELVAEGLLH